MNIASNDQLTALDEIITLSNASRVYKKHRSTLIHHIDYGNVRAKKIGRTWVLLKADLDAMYQKNTPH